MAVVFDEALVQRIEQLEAVVIGAVEAEGVPCAAKGWGVRVIDARIGRVGVLIPADDDVLRGCLPPGSQCAVTGAQVWTSDALQIKGEVQGVEYASEADLAHARDYCDRFFATLLAVSSSWDGRDELLERSVPEAFAVCVIDVHSTFDQTPGPRAGRALSALA